MSAGLEAEVSLIARFCSQRAVLLPGWWRSSQPLTLQACAPHRRQDPKAPHRRQDPKAPLWELGTNGKRPEQAQPLQSSVAGDSSPRRTANRNELQSGGWMLPRYRPMAARLQRAAQACRRGCRLSPRSGTEQQAASSRLALPSPFGSLGMAARFLPVPRYTEY